MTKKGAVTARTHQCNESISFAHLGLRTAIGIKLKDFVKEFEKR